MCLASEFWRRRRVCLENVVPVSYLERRPAERESVWAQNTRLILFFPYILCSKTPFAPINTQQAAHMRDCSSVVIVRFEPKLVSVFHFLKCDFPAVFYELMPCIMYN